MATIIKAYLIRALEGAIEAKDSEKKKITAQVEANKEAEQAREDHNLARENLRKTMKDSDILHVELNGKLYKLEASAHHEDEVTIEEIVINIKQK